MSALALALVQLRSGRELRRNVDLCVDYIAEAARSGARYIQTPEMTTLIEREKQRLLAELTQENVDYALAAFSRAAAQHGIFLHIGSMAIPTADGRVANRAHIFDPKGDLGAVYDKIHMFDVDLDSGESWRESRIYAPGDKLVVADLGEAIVAPAICYDLRFGHLFRDQAKAGAVILTAPAAFTRQTGEAHWHVLQRARAIEAGSFMVSAAQGGRHEDGRETFGHSLVVDPWGAIVAEKQDDEPGLLLAEIDLAEVTAAREKIPALKHDRQYDAAPEAETASVSFAVV
ncbi:MAG: carbon-nitrogen hydrolase family protein [Pseudomonadota bacterium]